jgi:hypothetical protein
MLGPLLEPHFGARGAVGLHELQVMRWLLDTCDSADQARQALLAVKQYYFMVPSDYIVAGRAGDSFVYENSTGRNVQHVIDGGGRPQIVTNFQSHRHPDLAAMPDGPPTPQTQPSGTTASSPTASPPIRGHSPPKAPPRPTPAPTSSGCWKQRHPAPADQGSPRR